MTPEQIELWRRRIRDFTLGNYQYEMGAALERTGEAANALPFYQRALEHCSDDPAVHFRLVALLERIGRSSEAAAAHAKALSKDPNYELKARCAIAVEAIKSDDIARADMILAPTLEASPVNGAVRVLAQILTALSNGGVAESKWDVELLDEWSIPMIQEAFEAAFLKLYKPTAPGNALALLEHGAALCADDARLPRILGDARQAAGDAAGAAKAYARCVKLEPGRADDLTKYGFMLQSAGDIAGSLVALEKAIALPAGPRMHGVYTFFSNSLFAQLRMKDAEALLRSAPPDLMGTADHLTQIGKALSAQERVAEAVTCLQAALDATPTAFWSAAQLSMALLKAGNSATALDRARSAGRLAGARWAVTFEGLALQQMGRIDEALDIQRQAVAAAPDNSWALTNLGLALKATGRDVEALDAHRTAAAIPIANLWLPFEAKLRPTWAQESLRDAYQVLGIASS